MQVNALGRYLWGSNGTNVVAILRPVTPAFWHDLAR